MEDGDGGLVEKDTLLSPAFRQASITCTTVPDSAFSSTRMRTSMVLSKRATERSFSSSSGIVYGWRLIITVPSLRMFTMISLVAFSPGLGVSADGRVMERSGSSSSKVCVTTKNTSSRNTISSMGASWNPMGLGIL